MPNKRPSTTTPDQRGEGDELHQGVKRGERMTTATGTPLGDGQNSRKVGDRGPTLLECLDAIPDLTRAAPFRTKGRTTSDDAAAFVTRCASLRHWDRDVRA